MIYKSRVISDFAFLLSSIEKTIAAYKAYGLNCEYTILVTDKGFIAQYEPYEL